MGYREEVRKLFEHQKFEVEKGDSCDLLAEKGEEKLAIFIEKGKGTHELEERVKEIGKKEIEGKKLVFTDLEPSEEEKKEMDDLAEDEGVEVSYFTREKGEKEKLPSWMPSSYEMIGDVAILNLEEEQLEKKEEIAEKVVEQNPNIATVINKTEPLSGEFRVGEYEKIRGESTETIHVEHGCRLKLDPTEVYYSERLGHERERVVQKIQDGEEVHVWFAGVGPYAVMAGKLRNPEKVHAVEKNPIACEYLKENIELNGLEEKVEGYCGDVREIAPDLSKADRIIMPLPKSSDTFLDLAFSSIKEGGVIHYYRIIPREEIWEKPVKEVREAAEDADKEVEILEKEVCGDYAPYIHRICLDFKVKQKA